MADARPLAVIGILAVAGALALSASPEQRTSARLQDQVEALEDDYARLQGRFKRLESRTETLVDRLGTLEKRIATELPEDIRSVPLKGGGTERWALPSGAAYVQFLRLTEDGTPVFTIQNSAGHFEVSLQAGESHVAVDDRGSELRVHTTTLHRLLRDRTGAPAQGLVSVVYEVRRP
jgi:hypothetical protein